MKRKLTVDINRKKKADILVERGEKERETDRQTERERGGGGGGGG